MKRHTLRILSAVCVVLFPAAVLAGDTLESVEKNIAEKWTALSSMSAKMTMVSEMDMGGQKVSMKAVSTFEYMKEDGKELYRQEMTSEQKFGAGEGTKSAATYVDDGEFLWVLQEQMGNKMVMKQKTGQMQGNAGGEKMLKDLHERLNLKLLPDKEVDGADCHVIEGTPKKAAPMRPAKELYYFGKDHGLLAKMVGMDADGKETMTLTFSDLEIDPDLDPERFVFEVPEGAQVMDMTEQK
jgi:outer membrane lipoprotein-sorting protein